jgi:choloylglycine hydrolase
VKQIKKSIYYFIISCLIPLHSSTFTCTGIRLKTQNGAIVYARTLEWRKKLNPYAIIVPRNTSYTGTSTDNKPGLQWTNDYAFTGITIGEHPHIIDGINEHGLAVGLFSFRDDVEYSVATNDTSNDIAPWEFTTFLLSTCKTIEEVKNKTTTVKVVPVFFEEVDEVPPLHYIVHDRNGNCIVLEHQQQNIKIYDNPIGTITNSPNFDWHITNLDHYLNPSFEEHKRAASLPGKTLHESYALGLPSDFSSPARFIRAAIYSQCAPIPATGHQGVLQAFHILNQFDIPKGAFRNNQENYFTYTHWTSAADLTEKKYYFRTYENQRIRMIDLNKANIVNNEIIWIFMNTIEDIKDITNTKTK